MSIRTIVTLTSTGDVTTGPCKLYGILNSGAAGTVTLRDGGSGGTVLGALVLAADQYIPLSAALLAQGGLHATLTTADEVSFLVGG